MPAQSIRQVLRRLEQQQIDTIYVLFGEEAYLHQEHLAILSQRLLEGAPRDFNFDLFQADSDGLVEALSLARTLPMMASCRVVVLQGIQQLRKADVRQLEQYAEAPSESTALICTSTDPEIKKVPRALQQNAVTIACKRLSGDQLHDWVTRTAARQQVRISEAAVEAFLQDQDNDLFLLSRELDKLCTYVGPEADIEPVDVHAVCYASRQQSIFALSDALGSRQIPRAFHVLEQLLQQGEAPLLVFSMIVRHLRLLWSVKALTQQRQDVGHIAKTLGLPVHVCRQMITHSRQMSSAQIQQLYQTAVEADLAFKSTNKSPQAVLERLVLALCSDT
ncbi:DNA polymerase III subunit delta [Candidatus Entotheonella palauensis]|uniref:DNA polymerase III subunit delta n=1 Tax=Candidatus Entotheonella palauensis TaxID=93172 RepID=UPI000B7D252B|nr:DNA polymerase III subunit delta [Candidatus Entotheonella palauensis]